MYSSSSMDRTILSRPTLPTLLRHTLQSKMAHFAALDVRTSIKLYEINTAFREAMILCIRILLTKDVDVI